jgi:small-conductance mechanosensitive channel
MLVMWGRRVSWKWVALFAALTLVVLFVATGVDLLRPEESRSHLGQLASDVNDSGIEVFLTTATRKLSTNVRVLGSSVWTWMVPIIAVLTIFLLFRQRRWAALLPPRSPLRAGAVGALATALLGFATNDSGVIVTALVFVYVGPYIVLLALEHERAAWVASTAPEPVRPAEPVAPVQR